MDTEQIELVDNQGRVTEAGNQLEKAVREKIDPEVREVLRRGAFPSDVVYILLATFLNMANAKVPQSPDRSDTA